MAGAAADCDDKNARTVDTCVKTSGAHAGGYHTHIIGAKGCSVPKDGSDAVLSGAIGCGPGNMSKKLQWTRVKLDIGERTGPQRGRAPDQQG